jgi:hypothetical protein
MPRLPVKTRGRRYLLLLECAVIRPDNWDLARHRGFDRIFTWHDGLVDGKKYFKINFPCVLERAPAADRSPRDKLCVVIAGNKFVRPHPLELYSRRIEAIRWFEKNRPEDFDLYGVGWDAPLTSKTIARALLYGRPGYVFARRFPSYRGTVPDKLAVLSRYKFSICFENARDIPGYITEKILDCFRAGCVPVYWGAPNVADHVPPRAFVDFRNFKSHEELHRYLKGMPETEYRGYREAIDGFLSGERAQRFGIESFVGQLLDVIRADQAQAGSR